MDWILNRLSIDGGVYRGRLTGTGTPPDLEMTLDGTALGPVTVAEEKGGWTVEAEMGTAPLSEGTRTVTLCAGDTVLDSVTVICGLDGAADLRAELDVLRAEMALVKQALRRMASGD